MSPRPSHAIVMLGVLVAALLCALLAYDLRREYLAAVEATGAATRNLARMLEEHARQSLQRVEIGVKRAMEEVARERDPQILRARLGALLPQDGLIAAFGIIGPDGRPVLATLEADPRSLPRVADRDYFVAHRDAAGRGMVVGAPARSRVDGGWMLPVSSRIDAPGGGFGGVLLASVEPARLRKLYEAVDVGPNGFVTLFQREGWIVARAPHNEQILTRNWADSPMFREHLPAAPARTVRQVVVADGVERIYSYRALEDFPVVVAVGLSLTDILVPWRQRAWASGATLLLALAALAAATLALTTQLRRREAAEAEARRLSSIVELSADLIATAREDGQFVYMNPAARRAAGIGPEEDIRRYRTQQFYSPERWAFIWQVARPAALKDGTWSGEWRFEAADGRRMDLLQSLIPHRDGRGQAALFTGVSRDITERKRAEQALQNRADLLRAAERMAQMTSIEWDIPADRLRWSRPREWLLGPRPPSGHYPRFADQVHPEDRQRFRATCDAALEGGDEHQLDCRIVRTDGEVRWIRAHGMVHREPGGRAVRMHVAIRDMTEDKRIETRLAELTGSLEAEVAARTKALASAEARLEQLLSATPAVIWSSRPDGDYARTYVSPNVRAVFGYAPEEFTANASFWAERIHPEDRPGLFARLPGEIETGRLAHEYRFRHANGDWRWVGADATVIRDAAGNPEQIAGYWIDITERKTLAEELERARERLRLALEASGAALWDADSASGEVYLSERWAEMLGAPRGPTRTTVRELVALAHPDEAPKLLAAIVPVLKGERASYREEHRVRAAAGDWRWVLSAGTVTARSADGRAARVSGINLDITARKKAEQAQAEALRAKTEFMNNVTHELRTPLNSVIGFAGLLKDGVPGRLNEKQAGFVADIHASGVRLLALVEGILEMSRLDASGTALERELMDVGAAVAERVAAHRETAEARRISIGLEIPPDVGRADLDPKALRRVLDALLDNAIRFNRDGGSVTVRARRKGGGLEVSVADTGIGIAPADLPKLFQPLVQLDAALIRKYGGIGMGLALARRLAELHGGTIEVESEPGRGSVFTLRLPARKAGA